MNRGPFIALMIPKDQLVDGAYYVGLCRNSNIARWSKKDDLFYHWRFKCGHWFVDSIDYWDVDGIFDGFIPLFQTDQGYMREVELPKGEETS